MDNAQLFDDVPEVEVVKSTRRAMNAIKWLLKQGYRPTIGGLTNLKNFELVNQSTEKPERFDIQQVLAEYDQSRRDEARARAAQKRLEKGQR